MKFFLIIAAVALCIFVLWDYFETQRLIKIGVNLANKAAPFSKDGSGPRILVIGDSTGVGTGASASTTSLSGLLSKEYPTASIENRSVNGSRTQDLLPRFADIKEHYDLMMIHIGGNDTVRFTDLTILDKDIRGVIEHAKSIADHVVIVSTGNVGTARLLPLGTRWSFTIRTKQVRSIFQKAASDLGATYVDLYREPAVDPYAIDPKKYYAADSFHPSDAGYEDWFNLIKKQLPTL